MSMSTLSTIPYFGIDKKQHDAIVDATGRIFTEPWRTTHLYGSGYGRAGGTVPKATDGTKVIDSHVHVPVVA